MRKHRGKQGAVEESVHQQRQQTKEAGVLQLPLYASNEQGAKGHKEYRAEVSKVHESIGQNASIAISFSTVIHHLAYHARRLQLIGVVKPVAKEAVRQHHRMAVEEGEVVVAHYGGYEKQAAQHYRLGH